MTSSSSSMNKETYEQHVARCENILRRGDAPIKEIYLVPQEPKCAKRERDEDVVTTPANSEKKKETSWMDVDTPSTTTSSTEVWTWAWSWQSVKQEQDVGTSSTSTWNSAEDNKIQENSNEKKEVVAKSE